MAYPSPTLNPSPTLYPSIGDGSAPWNRFEAAPWAGTTATGPAWTGSSGGDRLEAATWGVTNG